MIITTTNTYKIWTDGSCYPNPGPMGAGVYIECPDGTIITKTISLGNGTNNMAEFLAVIAAIKMLNKIGGVDDVQFFSDSNLMVSAIVKGWKMRQPKLIILADIIRAEMKAFRKYSFKWIPREENERADNLSRPS